MLTHEAHNGCAIPKSTDNEQVPPPHLALLSPYGCMDFDAVGKALGGSKHQVQTLRDPLGLSQELLELTWRAQLC